MLDGVICPSPYWPGLSMPSTWCLPPAWHQFWHLWTAVHANAPWDQVHKRSFSTLRRALASAPMQSGPPTALTDLLAATVTFRRVCEVVSHSGMLWIKGWPSAAGQALLRRLVPHLLFFWERTPSGAVFVASHPTCERDHWRPALYSLCGSGGLSPSVLPIRASFVYRTH